MDNAIKIHQYCDDITELFDGTNWVDLHANKLLDELDFDRVVFRLEARNSIFELLYHLISWRQFLISRLQGKNDFDISASNNFPKNEIHTIAEWEELKRKFRESQQILIHELQKHNDTILNEPVAGRPYNFERLIRGTIQHEYYHFGQMVLLR